MSEVEKYHIDINGVPAECFASERTCPRGGKQNHYSSLEEAQHYADFLNEINAKLDLSNNIKDKKGITIDEAKERAKIVEEVFRNPLIDRFNTKNFYFDSINEEWSEERIEQQKALIEDMYNKYKDKPCNKKVIISAGLPGAGKTTVLSQIDSINLDDYCTVNADDIKEEMIKRGMVPEVRGLTPLECAGLIHEESSELADILQKRFVAEGKNIIYDTTSKSIDSVKGRLDVFLKGSYKAKDITMVFVDITLDTSRERAYNRYKSGINKYINEESSLGGRYVPESVFNKCKPTEDGYASINKQVFTAIKMNKALGINTMEYDNNGDSPKKIS